MPEISDVISESICELQLKRAPIDAAKVSHRDGHILGPGILRVGVVPADGGVLVHVARVGDRRRQRIIPLRPARWQRLCVPR